MHLDLADSYFPRIHRIYHLRLGFLRFPAGIVLDPSVQPVCHLCKSPELDDQLRRVFGVRVCNRCKQKYPEKFSLLTKTEVKEVRADCIASFYGRYIYPSMLGFRSFLHVTGLFADGS